MNSTSPRSQVTAIVLFFALGCVAAGSAGAAEAWQPAKGPLMTRWARDVSPDHALPEYPRPQLVREEWRNLNGLWNYALTPKDAPQPASWAEGRILVPYPVESALSGVMKTVGPDQRLWYRRTFELPAAWKGQRILLHFGAVDWDATVRVNGREVGSHRGGYDAFSLDITEALKPSGEQELVVSVWDPSDAGYQPRGKQVRNPGGIWYTPTTGIWQTVWLEPVAASHVESIRIVPDVDASAVTVQVKARSASGKRTRGRSRRARR
jgi:beta-galactosidase/beta-glucuronidase